MGNPFEKMSIFGLFEVFVFFWPRKAIFIVLEHRKRPFPGLYCLKKEVRKMAFLGPKPWVNLFGKMSIFRILNFFFL